jgi:hypothetical protein
MTWRCRSAGLVAAAAVVVARSAFLGAEMGPVWVIYAVADIPGVECAVVVAATLVAIDGAIAAIACWLTFNVVVGVVVVLVGNLCLLQLRDRVRTAISYAWDVGLFFRPAVIRFGFGDFGRVRSEVPRATYMT